MTLISNLQVVKLLLAFFINKSPATPSQIYTAHVYISIINRVHFLKAQTAVHIYFGYERELINGGRELPSAHSWIGERGWISCRLIHSSTSRKKGNGYSFPTVIVWMMREIVLHPLFFCAWTEGSSFLLLLSFTEERIWLINTGFTHFLLMFYFRTLTPSSTPDTCLLFCHNMIN